jgi:hypothetical protein
LCCPLCRQGLSLLQYILYSRVLQVRQIANNTGELDSNAARSFTAATAACALRDPHRGSRIAANIEIWPICNSWELPVENWFFFGPNDGRRDCALCGSLVALTRQGEGLGGFQRRRPDRSRSRHRRRALQANGARHRGGRCSPGEAADASVPPTNKAIIASGAGSLGHPSTDNRA